jgi:hypothetical protein
VRPGAWTGLALVLLLPSLGHAWGPEGHRAAAAITAERLCPAAEAEVARLLGGMTLADAALWPDRIRSEAEWAHTRDWHYINIGDDEPFSALVEGEPGHGRLLSAIRANLALLTDTQAADGRRREALGFVLHLVGDLHQPLHVGRSEDRGGNAITVSFAGQETNLHRLWDGVLLRSAGLRPDDYLRSLAPLVVLGAPSWERGTLQDWAEESRRLRPWVYDFDTRRRVPLISKRYAETGRQLSSLRLAQAGVRTAWLLNQLWCE